MNLTGVQAKCVAVGFSRAAEEHGFTLYACAVLSDHCHLVVAPGRSAPGQIIGQLKRKAGDVLCEQRMHPLAPYAKDLERPPLCFARRGWKVYLDEPEDVTSAVAYVRNNPIKEGFRP